MNLDTVLARAAIAVERADAFALKALKHALPPGRMVKWKHGENERLGEVIKVVGYQFHDARVRVKSAKSGKAVNVSAWAIREEL